MMRITTRSLTATALSAALLLGACGGQAKTDGTADAGATGSDAAPTATGTTGGEAPAVATVGMTAPDFTLTGVDGKEYTLSDFTKAGKTVVLEWFNPDCPIVKDYHIPTSSMGPLAASYTDQEVVWLAINSGGPGLQGAGVERNQRAVDEYGIAYPVLLDPTGETGKRYAAKRTPHMYIVDTDGVLRYAGAIDNGKPGTIGDLNYVRQGLDQLLANADITVKTSKAFGCSVKYAKTYE